MVDVIDAVNASDLHIINRIQDKYSHYGDTNKLHDNTAVKDIRILLEILTKIGR